MAAGMTKLIAAPSAAHARSKTGGAMRSERFATALNSAPATKPSCTAIVSQLTWLGLRPQALCRASVTAEAENQSDIAKSSTTASKASCDQREEGLGEIDPLRSLREQPLLVARRKAAQPVADQGNRRGIGVRRLDLVG